MKVRPNGLKTSLLKLFMKIGHPKHPLRICGLHEQTIDFLQQINVNKCLSSIWHRHSNSWPLSYESPLLTTRPVVDVIIFFWRKSRFRKYLDFGKSLFWCVNLHEIFKQNYAQLFIAFKMAYYYCFRENLDFLQKVNINYRNPDLKTLLVSSHVPHTFYFCLI